MSIRNHVVVGADGSSAATRAVVAAAHEATLRGVPLRVVHAFTWPALAPPLGSLTPGAADLGAAHPGADPALREAAEQILREAGAAAEAAEPALECETRLVPDLPAAALLRASQDAELVVVGSRGLGGFSGLLLGSTAIHLSMYATCPVIAVRGEPEDGARRIVVGVDASEHAQRAIGFAFEEAAFRGASVHALHAWTEPASTEPETRRTSARLASSGLGSLAEPGELAPLVYDPAEAQAEAERLTAELLAGWREKHPDVRVTREVVRGRPAPALVEASAEAGLVVVGARGVGGFRGMLFGSVSQAVLHHSHCPVAIVRAE